MSTEATYTIGTGTALVGTGCALLLLDEPTEVRLAVLWPLVRDGADLHVLLEALSAEGMRAMGSFVLLRGDRVVVRGAGMAEVAGSGERFSGERMATWSEHAVDAGQAVLLTCGPDSAGPELPLRAGVVRAGSVSALAFADVADVADSPVFVTEQPVVLVGKPAVMVEPAVIVLEQRATGEPAAPVRLVEPVPTETVPPEWTGLTEGEIASRRSLVDDVPQPVLDEISDYDHLFGETVHRSIEDAAVRPPLDEEDSSVVDADHDGSTVLRSDLAALREDSVQAALNGHSVLGVRCPQGHANPPHTRSCRWCGVGVAAGEPVPVSRPTLGRLRVSDGSVVALDRTVLIGRAPSSSRFSADDPPHLLRVESPQQDISRTHVEVRVEDWDVLVVDVSANGTRLVRPGADPLMLHKGEPVLVLPGSTLHLGDGVTIDYEVES